MKNKTQPLQDSLRESPNDPKLSDRRSGQTACAEGRAKAAGWLSRMYDRVACSLERMVRPLRSNRKLVGDTTIYLNIKLVPSYLRLDSESSFVINDFFSVANKDNSI